MPANTVSGVVPERTVFAARAGAAGTSAWEASAAPQNPSRFRTPPRTPLDARSRALDGLVRAARLGTPRRIASSLALVPAPPTPRLPRIGRRRPRKVLAGPEVAGKCPFEGLNSRILGSRARIKDEAQASRLLSRLARLGLVANMREPRRRGDVKAWELTPEGAELAQAIATTPPTPPPSVALELMRASGRRRSERDVSVLMIIGAEPGLGNNDIARRVGIADKHVASKLLARLTRPGLIENARTGGRYNVWQLTPAGEQLERAIWNETPEHEQRILALGLRDRGGRLNHRVVSVLQVIGAEPELSNNEIAQRVGIQAKGHASTLLARLACFGLIENTRTDGRENAWSLTPSGVELVNTIPCSSPLSTFSNPVTQHSRGYVPSVLQEER